MSSYDIILFGEIMYKKDELRNYIMNSKLISYSEDIAVALSEELFTKYNSGCYDEYLKKLSNCWNMIKTLNIKFPGNANPKLYLYIVPDDNYQNLLKIPLGFDRGKGGGKPVSCYHLDGFNSAYGLSQNICENNYENISKMVNTIHELAHIIHSQFFTKDRFISEGFADALPLYSLNLEEKFKEHMDVVMNIKEEQILTAQQLINSQRDNSYGLEELVPNKSCSFRKSYISSYLFVMGCMYKIETMFNLSRKESTQLFLELVHQSNCTNEWLIYDIADVLDIPREELLNGKSIQLKAIKKILD